MSLAAPSAGISQLHDSLERAPVTDSEVLLRGRVWDVRRESVDLGPAGRVVREYVDHPGAVAVLAMRQDRGHDEILLIRQYRHPIGAHEWELPAGLLDVDGEAPVVAAARELAEEADLQAGRYDLLAQYVASPGGMNEALRIYLARELRDVPAQERHRRTEEEAGLEVVWAALDDVVEAVLAGKVGNAALVIGALQAQASRSRQWSTLRSPDEPWPEHPTIRFRTQGPQR